MTINLLELEELMALERDSFAYISLTSSWSVIDMMMKGKMQFITADVIYLIGAESRTLDLFQSGYDS